MPRLASRRCKGNGKKDSSQGNDIVHVLINDEVYIGKLHLTSPIVHLCLLPRHYSSSLLPFIAPLILPYAFNVTLYYIIILSRYIIKEDDTRLIGAIKGRNSVYCFAKYLLSVMQRACYLFSGIGC